MPRKKYDSRKVNIVGDFFEDLTEAMVKAERAPLDEGDFHIWSAGIGVEVKASDNNHELRLPLHQLDTYRVLADGFPFSSFFFFLFCYKNSYVKNGISRKVTSLSAFDEVVDVRDFLATNLTNLYIVDISIIPHLLSVGRLSDKSIPLHRGVWSLNLRQRHLELLADGGYKLLALSIRNLEKRIFTCNFNFTTDLLESHEIKMPITFIGRADRIACLMKSFIVPLTEIPVKN